MARLDLPPPIFIPPADELYHKHRATQAILQVLGGLIPRDPILTYYQAELKPGSEELCGQVHIERARFVLLLPHEC